MIGDINDEQKEKIQIILRNTDRLIGLIHNLLTVIELEKNRLELQIQSVSINETIIKILLDIQPQFEGKKSRLSRIFTLFLRYAGMRKDLPGPSQI